DGRVGCFHLSVILNGATVNIRAREPVRTPVFNSFVLEVFPRRRRVVITCHSPQTAPPIPYSLLGSKDIEVAKKEVDTLEPVPFSLNIKLKSRPDLLTYSCQAAATGVTSVDSAKLQMYWEHLLQAIFTLLDRGSGPRVEISCGAALGSPPITYSLLRKDGLLYTKESHNDGRPANFSLSLNQTSSWFRCQAENDHGVQFSPLRLLPPGERAPQLPGGSWGAGTGDEASRGPGSIRGFLPSMGTTQVSAPQLVTRGRGQTSWGPLSRTITSLTCKVTRAGGRPRG
uniref:IL-40-like Ig domain-containing protein n=1 Tax=Equus asinus TaxID=9793 RepID=A0A8C4LC60_EQUAS